MNKRKAENTMIEQQSKRLTRGLFLNCLRKNVADLNGAVPIKTFLNLEVKLLNNAKLHGKYHEHVKIFIELGYLENIPEKQLESQNC